MNHRWIKIFRQLNRLPEVARCSGVTPQWWPLASAYAGLRQLSYPYKVALNEGGEILLGDFFDLATFWSIFFTPAYPVEANDRVIIDAGANVGMFTVYAAKRARAATVVAIEPFPSTFQRLEQAVSVNALAGQVKCVNAALGRENGEALMPDGEMGSQFRQVLAGGRSGIPVRVLPLGQLLDSLALDQVDLLKMDIEGGEYPCLLFAEPAVLRRIRRICMEYHPAPDANFTFPRLRTHIEQSGFTCTLRRDDGGGYGMARFVRNGDS